MRQDGWEDGVFYLSEHIWCSAMHNFGRACVANDRLTVRTVVDRIKAGESHDSIDEDHKLAKGTALQVELEWSRKRQSIVGAERRARDWASGWWAYHRHRGPTPVAGAGQEGTDG